MISLLAYGMLMLAGAQALMLLLKEHQLGSRHLADRISGRLPPLDRMESLLIKIIALGLILLSIGLAVGGSALTEPFSPGMLHKMTFSALGVDYACCAFYGGTGNLAGGDGWPLG